VNNWYLEGGAVMKTISIFLALVNALLAGLVLAFNLSTTAMVQTEAWWTFVKMAAACAVIFIGMLTWIGSAGSIRPRVMALCSLFLVALGASTVVWTFHLALVSGDMEFYMVTYGASLAAQGMASMFGFANDTGSISST
jgi:hypothetical protein